LRAGAEGEEIEGGNERSNAEAGRDEKKKRKEGKRKRKRTKKTKGLRR